MWESKYSKYISEKQLNAFYEKVITDIENNIQDKGVWARAFAEAEGKEPKAKSLYITMMVDQLILEFQANEELKEAEAKKQKEDARRQEQQEKEAAKQEKRARANAELKKLSEDTRGIRIIVYVVAFIIIGIIVSNIGNSL